MALKISRSQVSTQPNPTHQKLKKTLTQPNPLMDPTHDQLCPAAESTYSDRSLQLVRKLDCSNNQCPVWCLSRLILLIFESLRYSN